MVNESPFELIRGNSLEVLQGMADSSVHCVVTSPPYWGLRDYGGWRMMMLWGSWDDFIPPRKGNKRKHWQFRLKYRASQRGIIYSQNRKSHICALGLEPEPELYIEHMVKLFRELRRVLRDDGTAWVVLGDSYANDGKWGGTTGGKHANGLHGNTGIGRQKTTTGLKPKDLCGIPWRVALALQADGWWLRSDIIWSKPNPMPESVRDRPTKAHEYIFLLTKNARYWYDAEAVKEPAQDWGARDRKNGSAFVDGTPGRSRQSGGQDCNFGERGRNRRSVWTIATVPFVEAAHFAVFPPKLIEPCILAGCPSKVCAECGAPWERVVEKTRTFESGSGKSGNIPVGKNGAGLQGGGETFTTSHRPTCQCNADTVPGVVLDPFAGSGTTGQVALEHGRRFIGIDLNSDYIELAEKRMAEVVIQRHIPEIVA